MTIKSEQPVSENHYRLVSVEKTTAPEGMSGKCWYHYVIERGKSVIDGMQPGSLAAVTQYAQTFVDNLNERTTRGVTTYATRKRK